MKKFAKLGEEELIYIKLTKKLHPRAYQAMKEHLMEQSGISEEAVEGMLANTKWPLEIYVNKEQGLLWAIDTDTVSNAEEAITDPYDLHLLFNPNLNDEEIEEIKKRKKLA